MQELAEKLLKEKLSDEQITALRDLYVRDLSRGATSPTRSAAEEFVRRYQYDYRVDQSVRHALQVTQREMDSGGREEFPCGHPRQPGDDICSGLDCNEDLKY